MTRKYQKRFVLLDAHAILHRAYHALPEFTSSKGEPTGALYGLSSMLIKIIQDLKPDYIAAAYDLPEPTYRHEAYEDYKAGRTKTDESLVAQINRSRDVFKTFNIPIYEHSGFEADDVLGAIVKQLKENPSADGLEIIIASGDMDTLQLVEGERVKVYTLKKGITDTILYDEKAVKNRFGFGPERLVDYKGLRGDPSDNIVGVTGIGEKTATELIKAFGSLENIYQVLEKDPARFEKEGFKPRIKKLLEEQAEEAEFSKMLATIRTDVPITFTLPARSWREGFSTEAVLKLFEELSFRTLSQRVRSAFGSEENGEKEQMLQKKTQEEKEQVVDEQEVKALSLALWLLRSDITNPTREDIYTYTQTTNFEQAREKILKELTVRGLERVYKNIELPLIPIIKDMEKSGIKIDTEYLKKLSIQYHKRLARLEKKIYKHAGDTFNINSPRQLAKVLFDKLELKPKNQRRTSTGQRSTRESELEKLKGEHPIIDEIFAYRELQKLLSTYVDNLVHMADKKERLHSTFLQAGTTTGRMASQSPNLQNIPIKSELGRNIRKAFIAKDGFTLAAFDYSQIELRIAAFLSGDEKLIDIFKRGADVHNAVAAQVFGVPEENVDHEMRRRAKVINFGIIYGMGVNALRANLGTTRGQAQDFYNEYFKNFSGLARYLDHIKADAERRGYTQTLFGRRRYFEGINSSLPYIRAQAQRMAINAPIQGTSADITKLAMIKVDEYIEKEKLRSRVHLLLQVHDELVYEIENEYLNNVAPLIKRIMEQVVSTEEMAGVPLIIEAKAGKNWDEMESL